VAAAVVLEAAVEVAAAAPAAWLVLLVVVGVGCGRDENVGRLALQECAEFLFESSASEERFLRLPCGGVHAKGVVDEFHQLGHAHWVILNSVLLIRIFYTGMVLFRIAILIPGL